MTTPYDYRPLLFDESRSYIRVLYVASASRLEDPVEGNFRLVNLGAQAQPEFSALSYVWGASESPLPILCGSHVILAQANAILALRHLRQKLGSFTIWVDSICINQHDIQEKENQISLMGQVYLKAKNVYVWLGKGNEKTRRAMAYLSEPPLLNYILLSSCLESGVPQKRHLLAIFSLLLTSAGLCKPKALSCSTRRRCSYTSRIASSSDLEALLSAEWLQRMWTFQEFLLATNPVLVRGNDHLSWYLARFGLAYIATTLRGPGASMDAVETSAQGWWKLALCHDHIQTKRYSSAMTANASRLARSHEDVSLSVHGFRATDLSLTNASEEGAEVALDSALRQYVDFLRNVYSISKCISEFILYASVIIVLVSALVFTG